MDQIEKTMNELIRTVPELTLYEGLGHCVYGSKLLQDALSKIDIPSEVLAGELLLNTNDTARMKAFTKKIILSMDDEIEHFSNMRKAFIRRSATPSPRSGHAVVLIGNKIYDITSGQFGLPHIYEFPFFSDCWSQIKTIDVTLGGPPDKFLVQKIKSLTVYNKTTRLFTPHTNTKQLSTEGLFMW